MSTNSFSVPVRTLNNGKVIPWIGFGTGSALHSQPADELATLAAQTGFKHFDGAQLYNNEDTLGKAIAKFPRESLFLTTKVVKLKEGESVRDSLQGSLKRLGVQYVDLWLIHSPTYFEGRLKEIWKGCEEVYKEGLAKSIGVSSFTVKQLEEILEGASVVPQINQIELHPYVFKAAQPLLEFHKKHGIVTESFGGLTPLSKNLGGPIDAVLQEIRVSLEKRCEVPVTEGQVLIKWLEAWDVVVVTTTSKETRMEEYLDAVNVPPLTPEEILAIEDAGSKRHFRRYAHTSGHMDE